MGQGTCVITIGYLHIRGHTAHRDVNTVSRAYSITALVQPRLRSLWAATEGSDFNSGTGRQV